MVSGLTVSLLILALAAAVLAATLSIQARTVKRNAIRLPAAFGNTHILEQQTLSLLHIGESTVAGVGVRTTAESFTTHILNHLSSQGRNYPSWEILGINGAVAADFLNRTPHLNTPNVLVITLGVNDTTGFTALNQWTENLRLLVARFAKPDTRVFFTSVPPMHRFPLLPRPLNWVLGLRAHLLNRKLQQLCDSNHWVLVKGTLTVTPELMAADGYHPNKAGYKAWAGLVADSIARNTSA